MVRTWISGGVVAVGLSLAAVSAQAATVTDATVDIAGSYALKKGKYRFSGDFEADILSNPRLEKAYDLGITIAFRGKTVLSDTIAAAMLPDSPFSIKDALKGKVSGAGIARLLGSLDVSGKVKSTSTSAKGSFDAKLGKGRSGVLYAACMTLFSRNADKKCSGSDFSIALAFSHDEPAAPLPEQGTGPGQPSPVPLPAGLPLLGAGIAAFAALRRRR